MAGVAVAATAAVVAASITTVQGLYMQQERYSAYYAHGVNPSNFATDQNPVYSADPDQRLRSFEPSVPEVTFIDTVDFPNRERPVETRILTGIIDVSDCFEGDYLFRITSDDASHFVLNGNVVIDNGGSHGPQSKWAKVNLRRGQKNFAQVWWGNSGGGSMLKLEYCLQSNVASLSEELAAVLSSDMPGGVHGDLLSAEDLASAGCAFTTDLSSIFEKHTMPVVTRKDFNGYYRDNLNFFNNDAPSNLLTKFLPQGVGYEAGGVIGANTKDGGPEAATQMSFHFSTPIAARVTGMHTFWVQSDDGAFLKIGGAPVVNNEGWHAPRWRKGSVYLEKGVRKMLDVYFGNDGGTGILTVKWEDSLSPGPMASLAPIMVL